MVAKLPQRHGPIPLILGATGHRHLRAEDETSLKDVVRKVLVKYSECYPSTDIVLLSSLAEGADRLVAREALNLGMALVVPMPLDQQTYEKDFAGPASIEEFRELLARAKEVFVVPSPPGVTERETRDHAYAACSAYIARHCVELIALWDGVSSPMHGTAGAVSFQLEGIPAPYVPEHKALDAALTGPVLHVAVSRRSLAGEQQPFAVRTLYPRTSMHARGMLGFAEIRHEIDRFNRDALTHPQNLAFPVLLQAEALAANFQRRSTLLLITVFTLIFVAALGFNIYQYDRLHPVWLLLAYLGVSACAFGVGLSTKRARWQNRYQDYRALAEGLRVAHYWQLAGIDEPVADRFAQTQGAEIDWLPVALRAVAEPFCKPASGAHKDSTLANLRTVLNEWVIGQYEYFTAFAGRRDHLRQRIAARIAVIGISLSFVITIGMRFIPIGQYPESTTQAILFVAAICALSAALVSGYSEKRGWTEHVKRYDFMAVIFRRAREGIIPLLSADNPEERSLHRARMILRSLGEEAIRESAAWLSLHRTRPFDVPKA